MSSSRRMDAMSERDGSRVTQILRDSILKLELRPGIILDEVEVANRLNVSRTPVREAIIQLVADGLVVRQGRKAKVAPLDFDDVPKLYDALLISSRLIHRLAAENRTKRNLKEIAKYMKVFEDSVVSGNGVVRSEANHSFHKAISEASGNKYVSAFYESALVGTIRLSRACFSDTIEYEDGALDRSLHDHLAETVRQHAEIYQALENHDVSAADKLAVDHYLLTKNRVVTILFSQSEALSAITDLSLDSWEPDLAAVP
ncbi:GntR family transcriptional regulator [Devosia ginsengisoli]|uniref:GntR family transcriptional regulator n=2 Tax=Devosia ginsengisoli TaxID=400770 RepID=A0A5B8LWI6_9HYPH|nr:GntR family transcriptional regulator [Devosia ginsengisoli]